MITRFLICAIGCVSVYAQPQTRVVKVNADGSFTPQFNYIKSGDTVRWEQLTRTDSIIPVDGAQPYPAMCTLRKPFSATDPNQFAGPVPFAPAGIFTLSPLGAGYTESTTTCPPKTQTIATGTGKVLCSGGENEATAAATWSSPNNTGVFIRLLWNEVNPAPGVFNFDVLRRELDQAVKYGKLYSLGVKAGDDGTPDWLFTTNPDDTPRSGGGGGIPRLHLQDPGDDSTTSCGTKMDLGNPTRPTYQQYYFAMLTELAKVVSSRADWYRALAYIKISGANLISHENRLPNSCSVITVAGKPTACPCNTAIFSADGYRPSGLQSFYDQQNQLLHTLFPGKPMSYALIQDGFPRISETGAYLNSDGKSSDNSPLPAAFSDTQNNLDRGQQTYGTSFVVQHNGIRQKPAGCNFDGVHPKPVRNLDGYWDVGSGCPNRWAVREGAEGQITGFQTVNTVITAADLESTLQNQLDNSDGVFFELYEAPFWIADNNNQGKLPSGKTMGNWADLFHARRIDPAFPNFTAAGNPFPATFSHTFGSANQTGAMQSLYYVHGMKCGLGKQEWGAVVVDPKVTSRNSASYSAGVGLAPDVIGYVEVPGIAPSLLVASVNPWPATLGGVSLEITDSKGQARLAGIYYVSPTAISFLIPAATAAGTATTKLTTSTGAVITGTLEIVKSSPGLFTASASGAGAPSGYAIRVAAGGAQTFSLLYDGALNPLAIDMGPATDQIYLSLYGTGFRGAATQTATAAVGGLPVPVLGFAPVTQYQGLDIVNVGPLPRTLIGKGDVSVALSFDGKAANTVTVRIK